MVAAIGLFGELGVGTFATGFAQAFDAFGKTRCGPEFADGLGGAAYRPPVPGLGQDQVPAGNRHQGEDDRDAVRDEVAARPQVSEAKGVGGGVREGFLHVIAPI